MLVAALVAVPAAAWFGQERLIFFPQPLGAVSHLPPGTEPLEVAAGDGTRLRGWIRPGSARPAPVVIYFGGNAEEVSWTLADRRWPREWSVVAVNYRGYGASEGKPGERALTADALAIHDAVAARPDVDASRIVAFGRSLGTGLAVRLAAERQLAGAILVSPYDSLVALGRTHYPWLPVSLLLRHRFDAAGHARAAKAPMLAVVGERDALIPPARSQALYDAWAGPKTLVTVPSAGHDSVGDAAALWASVAAFLEARLSSPR